MIKYPDGEDPPGLYDLLNILRASNLPKHTTQTMMENLFGRYGSIEDLYLPLYNDNSSRGYGFIRYSEPKNALRAKIKLDNYFFEGQAITVNWALPPGIRQHWEKHGSGEFLFRSENPDIDFFNIENPLIKRFTDESNSDDVNGKK